MKFRENEDPISSTILGPVDMDMTAEDEEATRTMIEDIHADEVLETETDPVVFNVETHTVSSTEPGAVSTEESSLKAALPNTLSADVSSEQNKSVARNKDAIMESLETAFATLTSTHELQDLVALHNRMRVLVSVEKLLELVGKTCCHRVDNSVCGAELMSSTKQVASRIDIEWKCTRGHYGKWESSEILTTNHHSKIFLNDSMMAIAIVLSGNNYGKFELLCKALNLNIISKTTFLDFQRNCAVPVVKDVWAKMQKVVLEILKCYEEICLCGDGRNDSPGHSARYCVYTLMEHVTNVVVDLEVLDKRETGGNSTTMEKEGLRRLLQWLKDKLPLSEICTDASATIIKLIRDMKGMRMSK